MLGERDEALGEVWHIPTPEPTTGWQFVRVVFEEVDNPPKIGAVSSTLVKTLGLFWPLAREGQRLSTRSRNRSLGTVVNTGVPSVDTRPPLTAKGSGRPSTGIARVL